MNWNSAAIRALVRVALQEDDARQDMTSQALIPRSVRVSARLVAKQAGMVCGLPLARRFFRAMDPSARFSLRVREGSFVRKGQALASIASTARAVLAAERPALNAVQHLSGIATLTHTLVCKLPRGKTRLYDTRKTIPGWRMLEKYAVACGGGRNHRMSLSDGVLVKDNHLMIARLAGIPWVEQLRQFRKRWPAQKIHVEIATPKDLREAITLGPDFVLLDNMPVRQLKTVIRQLKRELPKTKIEISGGVRPDQLRVLGKLGVDRISMGRLTHSAPAFDCSLDIDHVQIPRNRNTR